MKSPDYPPIVLSPCGHSFCAKCLSVHVGSQRKKLCPYCRQKIASTAVNLSLQRLIDSFVNIQDRRQQPAQVEHDKELFLDKLSAVETRSCILRNELAEALNRKQKLEFEKSHINDLHSRLLEKQLEAREKLRRVTAENESIEKEIRLIESQREDVRKLVDEENAKTALVDSSLRKLITVITSTSALTLLGNIFHLCNSTYNCIKILKELYIEAADECTLGRNARNTDSSY